MNLNGEVFSVHLHGLALFDEWRGQLVRPSLDALGLTDLADEATEWQAAAARGDWNELAAFLRGDVGQENRYVEIAGLQGSIGEQVLLAVAAEVEVALWTSFQESTGQTIDQAGFGFMALRSFAELQAYYVLGAANALVNLVLRILALDPAMRLAIEGSGLRLVRKIEPLAQRRGAWISLSDSTELLKLLELGLGRGPGVEAPHARQLVEAVHALHESNEIEGLRSYRDPGFHRRRAQTLCVASVPDDPAVVYGATDAGTSTRSLGVGRVVGPDRGLAEAQALAEAESSRAALRRLFEAMQGVRNTWLNIEATLRRSAEPGGDSV